MDTHAITLRLADHDDAEDLQAYFRILTPESRNHRFLGGVSDILLGDIQRMTGNGFFWIIAVRLSPRGEEIIGEALCAIARRAEIGLSVSDDLQGCGLGRALLSTVEALSAQNGICELYGSILSTNDRITALARSLGYVIQRSEGDWALREMRKLLPVCKTLPFRSSRSVTASPRPYLKGALRGARTA